MWSGITLCQIYGDYLEIYELTSVQGMIEGRMGLLGLTPQGVRLGLWIFLVIPSVMTLLSVTLRSGTCRKANMVVGFNYALVLLMFMPGTRVPFILLGVIEVIFTAMIVLYAWRWRVSLEEQSLTRWR